MDKVIAGIVTYNPDILRLKENITAISKQVVTLVIVDNYSDNIKSIETLISKFDNIEIIKLQENRGIAYALNVIGNYAMRVHAKFYLTLDQDSVVTDNLIEEYLKYSNILKDFGLISSYHIDFNDRQNIKKDLQLSKIEFPITSGSFMRTDLFEKGIRFNDKLFIDKVDYDMDLQLRINGYQLYRIPYIGFYHQLGDISYKSLFGKKIMLTNHSANRYYYNYRNTLVLAKKYGILNKNIINFFVGDTLLFWKILFFEKQKKTKLLAIINGIFDGFKTKN